MLMQIYADITGRHIHVSKSSQTCALGSAIAASVVAGLHTDIRSAQSSMCPQVETKYSPDASATQTYDLLFELYVKVHDNFGGHQEHPASLNELMKSLQRLKSKNSLG